MAASAAEAIDWTAFENNPLGFAALCWPHVEFYDKQVELIESVRQNPETFAPAANMVGKDFVAGFIALWGFLCHAEARVLATSVKDDHLRVLFGEVGRFINTSVVPLTVDKGGPLIVKHRDIRKRVNGVECKISYLLGAVSAKGEGLAGHHARYTLLIGDEASGIEDEVYRQGQGWAKWMLWLGNCNPCQNFFRQAVKDGSLRSETGYHRKVIRISAEDSPNVRRERMKRRGDPEAEWPKETPGVLSWDEFQRRQATWDEVRKRVGLEAEFWEGADILMFPPNWLDAAEVRAKELGSSYSGKPRRATAIGVDPGEGEASTTLAAVDDWGLIDMVSRKTPDTSKIPQMVTDFMKQHGVPPERVALDRGGGGKQHADVLRSQGYRVQTVAFGESVMLDPKRGMTMVEERLKNREDRYAYFNRRAQMYGELRLALTPDEQGRSRFAIPAECRELRRQLAPIPMTRDGEGRLKLLPKNKRDAGSNEKTLTELIGCSPDEADALVLALYARDHKANRTKAGAVG